MLRTARSTSAFYTRFIPLFLCYGLVLTQLSFATPPAAARGRGSAGSNVATSKLDEPTKFSASDRLNVPRAAVFCVAG